jgi:YggT family protein
MSRYPPRRSVASRKRVSTGRDGLKPAFVFNFTSAKPIYDLGQLYVLILVVRAVLSYFPYSPDSAFNPVRRWVTTLTEPVLVPFRRIVPPIGMLDVSFLVAFIVVEVIVREVLFRIPQ